MHVVIFLIIALGLGACQGKDYSYESNRPKDPWAFRSVLDRKPRMLTLALHPDCYVAYDLANSALYKAWKGGVLLEGSVFTNVKNIQPLSWGTTYFTDSLQQSAWWLIKEENKAIIKATNKGYFFKEDHITLKYEIYLPNRDTIFVEEQTDFIRHKDGRPGLERIFHTQGIPKGHYIALTTFGEDLKLKNNEKTIWTRFFPVTEEPAVPELTVSYDHTGRNFMEKSDCFTCHEVDEVTVGPSLRQIAQRYDESKEIRQQLAEKVIAGGGGVWGTAPMNPHPTLNEDELHTMLRYILSLKPKQEMPTLAITETINPQPDNSLPVRPGFGAPLEGVHPSYDLSVIRHSDFKPRVGGLAFTADGGLLVTTWDSIGGVYLLRGVETGDTSKITRKRIAAGLAEPLGIEVVDGEIFVVQKHELTRLIDHDGDEIIDEYQAICNTWTVSNDFHEFAFGPVYKDGHFYITLSLAMRLMSHEKQQPDRGRTIKVARDGTYEWINYGLRTPNGIGIGPDDELFLADNQGQWLPGNKIIHIRQGEFHGMRWNLPDPDNAPPMTPPAIWLPQDEIGNSPSEPVLMHDGPYEGQLLHGEVTNGGIKRDFLEKVNDAYQGAVFRFTQGLEAGINRIVWGPDGALYAGGVGMVGGWSWKEKQFGLQRIKYNGKLTFEMLAVRAQSNGFEIEFTAPLDEGQGERVMDYHIEQWRYVPTARYGGPKIDHLELPVKSVIVSDDRTKARLNIPGLKKEHVVYFRLADDLTGGGGQGLWSSEAWYTLNNIPQE